MSQTTQPQILTGPPASGKSTRLLQQLRDALRQRDWSVHLLVPSSTMVEHQRNLLAREGLVLRSGTVATLTGFVDRLELTSAAPTAVQLEAAIEQVLKQRCPAEYEPVATQPGFIRHLAQTAEALSLAQVDPAKIEQPALRDVYTRILKQLAARKFALRGHRLIEAANRLTAGKLDGARTFLLDGFFSFSKTEQHFLHKLASLAEVRITQTDFTAAQPSAFRTPEIKLVEASDQTHEAEWIAGEILRHSAEGVELRRIGILLRDPATYTALIESTLARFAIPSRSYLGMPLAAHPIVEFHRAVLRAVEQEWDNEAVLGAMRWRFTGLGDDALELRVLEQLPSNSLELFPQLKPVEDWPGKRFTPADAAEQIIQIAGWIEAPHTIEPTLENAWTWHQRISALNLLHEAIRSTAEEWDDKARLTLNEFWAAVESNLASQTLHERDTRRNVVHLMDLFESRQWELDYVFAPGLSEADFPRRFAPDPMIPEAAKRNFGMKTLDERTREEHELFTMLCTRARTAVTLTYPAMNAKGDPNQPSPLIGFPPSIARAVTKDTPPPRSLTPAGQLTLSYRKPRPWSASEFENYLGCPWRHFAERGLELHGLPDTPAERLNYLLLGNVAHETIKQWTLDTSRNIESIAERTLERACKRARVPHGYNYERERINLLRNMRIYAQNAPEVPAGWTPHLEEPFEFQIPDGPAVRGQIDRYDQSPTGEIHAYDYKYSRAKGLDEKYPIQAALYAMVLGEPVTRFSFVALREQAEQTTLEGPTLKGAMDIARGMIESIVDDVRQGKNPVQPRDPNNCQYCEFMNACRIRTLDLAEESGETAETV